MSQDTSSLRGDGAIWSGAAHAGPLGSATAEDEFLHAPPASGHYTASETSYYGFSIPERRLNGEIYVWFHPVLRVISCSLYIWRGLKTSTLACNTSITTTSCPSPRMALPTTRSRRSTCIFA